MNPALTITLLLATILWVFCLWIRWKFIKTMTAFVVISALFAVTAIVSRQFHSTGGFYGFMISSIAYGGLSVCLFFRNRNIPLNFDMFRHSSALTVLVGIGLVSVPLHSCAETSTSLTNLPIFLQAIFIVGCSFIFGFVTVMIDFHFIIRGQPGSLRT